MNTKNRLAAVAGLLVLASVSGGQSVSSGLPPGSLTTQGSKQLRLPVNHALVRSIVTFKSSGKEIILTWRAVSYGNEIAAEQHESVAFWPTAVAAYGENKLLVAGKRNVRGRDNTVIELWTLDQILQPPLKVGPVGSSGSFQPFSVSITAKETVYDRADIGRDLVRGMLRQEGTPDSILVLFNDSNDLYSISTVSGTYTLVLSSSSGPIEHEAALSNPYDNFWAAEHLTYGYTYVLHTDYNSPDGDVPTLVLTDANKDGVLDPGARFLMDATAWIGGGFSDRSNWAQQ